MSWPKAKLGYICRIEKGLTGINKAIPGVYPMVVTSEARKSHNEYQFDDNAVIIPLVSSTGHGHKSLKRIHFQQGKFALGSILCAVIPRDKTKLSAEYLFRYLDLNRENELVSRMKGMANVTLPMKEIAQIEIPLPPIENQIEFTRKYHLLENNSELISDQFAYQLDLLKKLRQQILQDAVQGKLVPQDPNDEPATVLLEKIKAEKAQLVREKKIKQEKPLPAIKAEEVPFEIPKSWVWCRLGTILTEIKYGTSKSCDYDFSKNSKVLRIPNVSGPALNDDDLKFTNLSESEQRDLALREGDILIIRSNGSRELVGKTVLVTAKFVGYAFAGYLIRLRFNNQWISGKYLWLTTIAYYFRELIEGPLRTTVGINNINTEEITNLLIPVPSNTEQHRIVTKVDQLMAICDDLEQSIRQNQEYTQKLLQVALKEALEPG